MGHAATRAPDPAAMSPAPARRSPRAWDDAHPSLCGTQCPPKPANCFHLQDAFIVERVEPLDTDHATILGVYDGHGPHGHQVARHVSRQASLPTGPLPVAGALDPALALRCCLPARPDG